jgi:pre-mRNA-processing factor 40
MKELERKDREEKEREREIKRREDRIARDNFKALLAKHRCSEAGLVNGLTDLNYHLWVYFGLSF